MLAKNNRIGHYKLFRLINIDCQWIIEADYKLFWNEKTCFLFFRGEKIHVSLPSETKQLEMSNKKLYRSRTDKKLCGVCGGLGEYFEVDPTLIRLLWVVFTCMGGAGLLAYIICAVIMPQQNYS